jgi:hypothetical protein
VKTHSIPKQGFGKAHNLDQVPDKKYLFNWQSREEKRREE